MASFLGCLLTDGMLTEGGRFSLATANPWYVDTQFDSLNQLLDEVARRTGAPWSHEAIVPRPACGAYAETRYTMVFTHRLAALNFTEEARSYFYQLDLPEEDPDHGKKPVLLCAVVLFLFLQAHALSHSAAWFEQVVPPHR